LFYVIRKEEKVAMMTSSMRLSSPVVLQYVINSDLGVLSRWFGRNYLQINAAKTQAVSIGLSLYEYKFNLNDKNVEMQDTLKILGVVLDNKKN